MSKRTFLPAARDHISVQARLSKPAVEFAQWFAAQLTLPSREEQLEVLHEIERQHHARDERRRERQYERNPIYDDEANEQPFQRKPVKLTSRRTFYRNILKHPDFHTLVMEFQKDGLVAGAAKYKAAVPHLIDYHLEAAELAREKEDLPNLIRITEGAVERAVPKKNDTLVAQQITVTIAPRRERALNDALEAEPTTVTWEPIAEADDAV